LAWLVCSFRLASSPAVPANAKLASESDFEGLSGSGRIHRTGILIPIDIPAIGESLGVDPESAFGRLYYHLDPKYAPSVEPGAKGRKVLFTPKAGDDANCINFPLLEAVLAGLWQERRRDLLAIATAVVSFAFSVASLIVALS